MKPVNRVEWLMRRIKGKDVLDVGCAGKFPNSPHGQWLHYKIRENAKSVLGIDINKAGILEMRKSGYDAIYANAEKFISKRKFDSIVFSGCLEHMDNLGLVLDCAWENLREDGELLIATPNGCYFGMLYERIGRDHRFLFAPKTISNLLEAHKFRVCDIQFFSGEGKLNLIGKIYETMVWVYPRIAIKFGVVAKKVIR